MTKAAGQDSRPQLPPPTTTWPQKSVRVFSWPHNPTMGEKKTIAVVGATGAQGGGLVRAIQKDTKGSYRARALTRTPDSDKAKALADLGAEVVAFDIDDHASVVKGFEGAYGAFCVTFFWDHFSPDLEMAQAESMAKAAKETGLQHIVWSTLEDTRKWVPLDDDRMPTLQGKYKVPHFDAKGESDHFFSELGLPVTFLLTSFYWDNFIHFGMGPASAEDSSLSITLPMGDKKLPGMAAEDIGRCAYGLFKDPKKWIGERVGVAGGHLTGQDMAMAFSELLGQPVTYNAVEPEVYRSFDFPGADDLGNMFQFKRDFEEYFCGARNLGVSKKLNPDLQTFPQWLKANKEALGG